MMSPEEKSRRRREWKDKAEKRRLLIEKVCAHSHSHGCARHKGCSEYEGMVEELYNLDPKECEHGRSWASSCLACDEIHKEVFPEHYAKCFGCKKLADPDELNEKERCFDCQGTED